MCMSKFFNSDVDQLKEQDKLNQEKFEQKKDEKQIEIKILEKSDIQKLENDHKEECKITKAKQLDYLENISLKIFQTSK